MKILQLRFMDLMLRGLILILVILSEKVEPRLNRQATALAVESEALAKKTQNELDSRDEI